MTPHKCPVCDGTGKDVSDSVTCFSCDGTGVVWEKDKEVSRTQFSVTVGGNQSK